MKRVGEFPFCAVLGQESMKNALLWNVVNPQIGGVLLCGEKGTAKSTVVRGLAGLLADISVVELPLNVTEDRLIGSIDIEAAIKDGVRRFEPGILKEADQNFLYIDEVNLLSDHIINSLLETAASGVNHVEREGTSYSHPARFYLVGSMNPEEGKLRPQFLDRFGLYVTVKGSRDYRERAEITRRKLEYDKDPIAFSRQWAEEQEVLREKLNKAKENLNKVQITEEAMKLAAVISAQANCAGQRAELTIVETARAIAALEGRTTLNQQDIRLAAEYALPHRMRQAEAAAEDMEAPTEERKDTQEEQSEEEQVRQQENPWEEVPSASQQQKQESNTQGQEEPDEQGQDNGEQKQEENLQDEMPLDESAEENVPEEIQEIGKIFQVRPWIGEGAARIVKAGNGRRSLVRTSTMQGRYVKSSVPKKEIRDIAFDATLRAAAPYQRTREHHGMALAVEKDDIRIKVREKRTGNTILFVVDASGSMGANQRMKAVKGAICSLLNDAYQKRDKVGMIAFRKKNAELLLGITRSVELAQKKLEVLPTGGRTPLSAGLAMARDVLKTQKLKDPDCIPILVLLSDGRANAAYGGENPVKEAIRQAEKIRKDGVQCIVVDTEKDFIRLRLAEKIAEAMQADYFKIEDLDAELLTGIVSQLSNS